MSETVPAPPEQVHLPELSFNAFTGLVQTLGRLIADDPGLHVTVSNQDLVMYVHADKKGALLGHAGMTWAALKRVMNSISYRTSYHRLTYWIETRDHSESEIKRDAERPEVC